MSKDAKKESANLMLKRTSTFRQTKTGVLEEYNIETGELIKVHGSTKSVSVADDHYHEVDLSDGRKVLVSSQVNPAKYVNEASIVFSWMVIDLICQRIREGATLTAICKLPGYPSYSLLCEWRRLHPEIDGYLEQAREDRGEYFADEAIELRNIDPYNKTQADDKKTNFEILKWGAEKGNRSRYGNSTKVEVSGKVSHAVLVVETGVRKNIEGVVVDETARIREAQRIEEEGGDEK